MHYLRSRAIGLGARAGTFIAILTLGCGHLVGQSLRLSAVLGKDVFFEGEPIYGLFELRNDGSDTVWTAMFGFAPDLLSVSLRRSDGKLVPGLHMWADFGFPPGYRGNPLAPGERTYQMVTLQNRFGEPVSTTWTMFPTSIPVGDYTLVTTFNAAVEGQLVRDAVIVAAPPLSIKVRRRTPAEEVSYREVERLCKLAWDRSARATYFKELLALIDQRLTRDSADPFAAFLVNDAVATGYGVGLALEPGDASRLTAARLGVARAQRSLPAGAMAGLAALTGAPTLTGVADMLRPSMAATVVGESEALRRREAPIIRPP